jgi:predicted aspartyl protease
MTYPALAALAAPLVAAVMAPLPLGEQVATQAGEIDLVELDSDRHDRLTVAVRIGESGPYRFLIDTGAERTVLARGVAERLALPAAGRAILLGIAGAMPVDLVEVDTVTLGRRSFYGLTAPVLDAHHIGADGIIGIDGLQDQRVLLDFGRQTMAVSDSRSLGGNQGFEIVVRARRRAGQLIMTNAFIDGVKTDVVIDTGAESTIANRALQRRLANRRNQGQAELLSVTGQRITADMGRVRELRIGRLKLENLNLAFADAPPFKRLALDERPALLLGMNELRAFKRVAIDFDTRKVLFDLPEAPAGTRR